MVGSASRLSTFFVEAGDAVVGMVSYRVNDCGIDGGAFDVAMSEEFGDGVEVSSCHECHRGVAVASRVEGDVLGDAGTLYPLCDDFLDGGYSWQREDGLVGMSLARGEPTEGIVVEFVGDGFLCFLHDDGVAVVITYLLDVAPSDVADIAKAESCEAAEEEALLDGLVEAWGVDEPCNLVGMKE